MGWTKQDIVTQAFEDAGLAAFVFDLSADQIASAVRRLDNLMATWAAKGITFPYPMASSADANPSAESNLPDYAIPAAALNLAVLIAPGFGKVVSPDVKASAKQAYDALLSLAAAPGQVQITGLPSGAGSKLIDYPFLTPADKSPVRLNGNGDSLVLGG